MDQQQAGGAKPNYAEKISQLQSYIKELTEKYAKDSSEETHSELMRRTDTLLHLKNLSKGDPKARAERASVKAREFVRSIAIVR